MSGAGSVRVPISADAAGVRQALEQVQQAINSVAKGAKTFGDIDLEFTLSCTISPKRFGRSSPTLPTCGRRRAAAPRRPSAPSMTGHR